LMDFATRDKYRHVVERISKSCSLSETEVAQKAIGLTLQNTNGDPASKRRDHVGYYLIDDGLEETEHACRMRYTLALKFKRIAGKLPVFLYIFSIFFLAALFACGLFYTANNYVDYPWKILTLVALLSFLGCLQLAVSLVNWLSTVWVQPQLLPRMDFSQGVPTECRSLVVIPTMLSSAAYIEELIEGLEIRYLANRETNVHYGLLTDFMDADVAQLPGDENLVALVKKRIEELNEKYETSQKDTFCLFHRPRKWNPREKKWMGYERKRGKLSALNAFLRKRGRNDFSLVVGDEETLSNTKYVITLDSDTQLPRESVWKFIATMAHPLNHAVYDPRKKRVTGGYGVLQPRVEPSIPKTAISLYLRMQGSLSGVDPYTQVSSDVYQDVFGEGSFIGKGIYDVDVFEKVLDGVFPENRILSHDLLEGCYIRSGLLSDVYLYEEGPAQYQTDVKRHHRWIRGDWQIGAWMLPFVPDSNGHLVKNKLSALSRWKIFDNLRRSMVSLALTLLLLMGWFELPYPWFWTAVVTIIVLLPLMAAAGWQLINKPEDITIKSHFVEVGISVRDFLVRFVFDMAVLPYEAYKNLDAIIRTNWRMIFSKKKLLQWTPSAASRIHRNDVLSVYTTMWIAPLLSVITIGFLIYANASAFYVASPILLLWLLAPALAWRLSKEEKEEKPNLSTAQNLFLHKAARKTWSYFEEFVTSKDNWLPPDNFQEQPSLVIAHRTSPTNMGLALLANLAACDFGYMTGKEMAERCKNTLQTMLKLERFSGHFYNWYDTISLLPLHPRYVSTVDSGNLVGHLLTLRQGLLSQINQPIFTNKVFESLLTTVKIIRENGAGYDVKQTEKIEALLNVALNEDVNSLSSVRKHLDELGLLVNNLSVTPSDVQAKKWVAKLVSQVTSFRDDLVQVVPWIDLLPAPENFEKIHAIDAIPSLSSIVQMPALFSEVIAFYHGNGSNSINDEWLNRISQRILENKEATERISLLEQLAQYCEDLSEVEYDFLLDRSTNLLRIGYNVEEQRKDNSYYDLLASEARLGIFAAISQGKLTQESWFALGRLLTNSGGDPILLSWSGSMFEYLMPQLVMPSYENTLLYQTNKATVKRQIEYGAQREVPWGISESGYNSVDANLNYQYKAFGVPGLGLKRGLEEDLVIAPYASMLALMISPLKACNNLQRLSREGLEGEYGFFEAVDYTPSRVPRGSANSIVHSYMAHHQGMSFLSLAYVLLDKPMQHRFESELRFNATLLLLQERIPRTTIFYAHTSDIFETNTITTNVQVRTLNTPNTRLPEIQLLSNGHYQVMISNAGGGYSRWKNIAVTRWREDSTKDDCGIFCYIKDISSGKFWSNTYQPTLQIPKNYEAIFSQGHVEFRRYDFGMDTKTEIVISPEDDTELRRIRITNKTSSVKLMEVTSYAEVVIASQASDEAHPAFSNLFVQTQIMREHNAIYCTRRPRSEEELPPWIFHLMHVSGCEVRAVSYETDRMQFTGRGRTVRHPQAMEDEVLSGKDGAVLDPVMSIRYRILILPNQTATVDLVYGIADTKESCEGLMHKYQDKYLKRRAFELSWTHSQVLLRQINATESDAQLYDRLAASIIYGNAGLRADAVVIQNNYRGQSGLWSHSISGDLPIVLLHVFDQDSVALVKQLIQAHAYWRLKGLAVDLVIWNEDHGSYRQFLQEQILGFITADASRQGQKLGNIYVKSADQLSSEDRLLFESVARIIISDNKGSLLEQVSTQISEKPLSSLLETEAVSPPVQQSELVLPDDLLFFNGTGGFTKSGNEYKILTDKNKTTPAPWVNVIANPLFGSVVSETGSSYTWAVNAHEYRITPWNNDPVGDVGGEAFYLRDEESGNFWCPSPFPKKSSLSYITTHGFGYSVFEHAEEGIHSEMSVFVDKDLPVKFVVLKIKNESDRERKLSVMGFLEIILGDVRSKTNMHILSEHDPDTGALLFRNRYNSAFSERISFFKVSGGYNFSFTADRSEFIGRNRQLNNPQALHRKKLSGRTGAAMDSCAALHVKFDLLSGAEKEIIFQIGSEVNISEAKNLLLKFSHKDVVQQSLQNVKEYWKKIVTVVRVATPDASLNILANGWLIYQTIACRMFARSGFYQSGGAFGFRDQLQDSLALLHTQPAMAREQILLSASRQFTEGDVQHWWHPPGGAGVRTRCSDDMLWLPFVVARYVSVTGDSGILQVPVSFLESRTLHEGEDSLYDLPVSLNATGTLYEHCVRAIKYSYRFGEHGLPLIGAGDWNDGMDRVGNKGKGESVWLAFFLYDILIEFSTLATNNGDTLFAANCKKQAAALQSNIETSGWDGEWYRRAYFDDGTPLGSKENVECRIDAIAQSWSVLSGAANEERKKMAMASLDKYLVRRDLKLIQLLDPPFDASGPNPGYIKGYVPGVRENGGQYSHAAIWSLMAFAALGDRQKVWELFSMIQPLNHATDDNRVSTYKVEPYVMPADVYANESHKGRGGWTWYTGSAGWMYQFIIGSLLGIELQKDQLKFKPCFPSDWPSVSITYKYGKSTYHIHVFQHDANGETVRKSELSEGTGNVVKLIDDGLEHTIEVHTIFNQFTE
jgi:cyclic beta-1,2-glucan glucanotransferase